LRRVLFLVVLLIVHGTLYPWEFHPHALPSNAVVVLLRSWASPAPNRFGLRDVAVNLSLYVPFGILGYLALRDHARRALAVTGTLALATLLSAGLEIAQVFVPTRTCSLFDVLLNVAGTALGVAYALRFEDSLVEKAVAAVSPVARAAAGPLVLLSCWAAYQLFPFFPDLSLTHLAGKLVMLARPESWSAPHAFVGFAEWLAAFALIETMSSGRPRGLLALLLLLPLKLLCAGRTVSGAEAVGAVAAVLASGRLRPGRPASLRALAWLLLIALILDGLMRFPLPVAASTVRWAPFAVLLQKCFASGTVVWLFRRSGWRLGSAALLTSLLVAGVEAVRAHLVAAAMDMTGPLLVVLMAAVLMLVEGRAITGSSAAARWSRQVLVWASVAALPGAAALADAPGGFIEKATDTAVRPVWTASQVAAFLPERGKFTFPAPYNTQGIRLTNTSDCRGGADCVNDIGYSYWRNINNHVGSDTMLIFLGLQGNGGPTLFSYDKTSDKVVKVGPLFDGNSVYGWHTGEGWYFSARQPTKLYVSAKGPKLERFDVITKKLQTVFDVTARFGPNRYIWQTHSSNDDNVHSATLKQADTGTALGCLAYREDTRQFFYYPVTAEFDECQIDKSGRWLLIKDNVDGTPATDNRFIDLQTGAERLLRDPEGAGGHSDNGYGYMIAADDWNALPGAMRVWNFDDTPPQGLLAYRTTAWDMNIQHVSHANAVPGLPLSRQYGCGGGVTTAIGPRANEIVCFRLDDSLDVLVVTQNMTSLGAAGGRGVYGKHPKGNLDVTGQYFIWTTNLGGNRLDAFIVKVPAQLLVSSSSDVTPPTVSIINPAPGSSVTGLVPVSAQAADDVGVRSVRFQLDGQPLEHDVTARYTTWWDTTKTANGSHSLTAVARDGAGNATASSAVVVRVNNDTIGDGATSRFTRREVVVKLFAFLAFGILGYVALRTDVRRPATREAPRGGRSAAGPMLLLGCWAAYQLLPFFPDLSRAHLAETLQTLARPGSWSAHHAFVSFAEWLAVAALIETVSPGKPRTFPALLLLLPLKVVCAGRTVSGAEVVGAVAAVLVFGRGRAGAIAKARALAWLLLLALILDGLLPLHFPRAPASFHWVPFVGLFQSGGAGLLVLLRKSFVYGSLIWLLRRSGWRFAPAAALASSGLAGVEALQAFLPGRTAEVTDPLLVVVMAIALALLEGPAAARATSATGTRPWWQQ